MLMDQKPIAPFRGSLHAKLQARNTQYLVY